jgi:hypothetical protein
VIQNDGSDEGSETTSPQPPGSRAMPCVPSPGLGDLQAGAVVVDDDGAGEVDAGALPGREVRVEDLGVGRGRGREGEGQREERAHRRPPVRDMP